MLKFFFFCILCFFFDCSFAKAVFVAPTGNDHASGDRLAPFGSVSAALNALRGGGGEIILRAGTYYERVQLTASDSNIVIKNHSNEKVVFDGNLIHFANREHGVFQIDGSSNVSIVGLYFVSSSASGISICHAAVNILIFNNKFEGEFGWSPIKACYNSQIVGLEVRKNLIDRKIPLKCIWSGKYGCWSEMISISGARYVVIADNFIRSNPLGEGIDVKDGSSHIVVKSNKINSTMSNAIYLDARGVLQDVLIAENVISNISGNGIAVATEAFDFGGADIFDVIIRDNFVERVKRLGLGIGWFTAGRSQNYVSVISDVLVQNNSFIDTAGILIGQSVTSGSHVVRVSHVKFLKNNFIRNGPIRFFYDNFECQAAELGCSVSVFLRNHLKF